MIDQEQSLQRRKIHSSKEWFTSCSTIITGKLATLKAVQMKSERCEALIKGCNMQTDKD